MMPTTNSIQQFSTLLGKKITGKEVVQVVAACEGEREGGQFNCYKYGFDILSAEEGGQVVSIRFLTPLYSDRRGITSYKGAIVEDLSFPLTRGEVRSKLGKPAKTTTSFELYDQYDYSDHVIRFVYPLSRPDDVIFVRIEPLNTASPPQETGKAISVKDRLAQLDGSRKKNWITRLDAYETAFGPVKKVYPGANPDIDVLVFRENEDYYTLITSGMSDQRMFMPKRSEDPCRLELEMYVKEVKKYHIERLTQAAEFPFVEKTYLGHGDTIDWLDPIARGSDLDADLIMYSILANHRERSLTIHRDPVQLLWCVPISSAELEYKKEEGIDALLEVFDDNKHPLVLDVHRKSYV
jgi:hypothetical protein